MRQRVVTALLLAVPALLALALRTPWPLAALGLAAAAIGGWEADLLLEVWGQVAITAMASFVLVGIVPMASGMTSPLFPPWALLVALAIGVASTLAKRSSPFPFPLSDAVRAMAGFWIAAPLLSILVLHRSAPGTGLWCLSPALMALVPVWAGDIAAIFAGKAFGKHPLAPKISPKKTVEGSVANLLAAILIAWILGRLLHLTDARSLGAGIAVGVLGQAGDLFESWLKRRAGVKDSGTLLPGHGGVLDRIDSVLFAAPAVALILLS